jgi:homoisocitrate dehydrogenase
VCRQGIDLIIVRENTEDLYVGDEQSDGEVAVAIKRITRTASLRVARSAFELARHAGRQRITIIHKANILPRTDGLFRDCAREVALEYPEIAVDEMLVDTAAMRLAQAPESFDMLLAPNLYGDILSDLVAAFGGGLGLGTFVEPGRDGRHCRAGAWFCPGYCRAGYCQSAGSHSQCRHVAAHLVAACRPCHEVEQAVLATCKMALPRRM